MVEQVFEVEFNGKTYLQYHGNAFDRGSADSYYNRQRDPHIYPQGTYNGARIEAAQMSADEIEAYNAGYDYNEEFGDKKDWGSF